MIEPTDEQIEAFMMATVWRDGDVTSHVFDFMKEGDGSDRELMKLPPSSGTSLLAQDEMLEFYHAVIRAGLRAALNC